jgi:hypothetical protein
MGLGQRASPAAGLTYQFKSCASAAQIKKRFQFNSLRVLQCINWTAVHAFFKGMSPNSKRRIMLLNV